MAISAPLVLFAVLLSLPARTAAQGRLTPPEGTERPSPMLQRLVHGIGPENILGAADTNRPLIGMRFRSQGNAERDSLALSRWRCSVDFVQINAIPDEVMLCERAGVPWQGIADLPVRPGDVENLRSLIGGIAENYRDFPNLAGWTGPSEPALPDGARGSVTDPTLVRDFQQWLQLRYGDELPGVDTNADGFTLNSECGLSLRAWEDVVPDIVDSNALLQRGMDDWRKGLIPRWHEDVARQFQRADPLRRYVPILPDPAFAPAHGLDLNCYQSGDAVGASLWPGVPWESRPEAEMADGFELIRQGASIHVTLSNAQSAAFCEWDVTLPPGARLKFGYSATSAAEDIAFRVTIQGDGVPQEVFNASAISESGTEKADVPLDGFGGQKVILRLENTLPSPLRLSPQLSAESVSARWDDPILEAAGQSASLLEAVNWWQTRAGFRPNLPGELARDVNTGPTLPGFSPSLCEFKLSLMTNCAASAGKRFMIAATHPTGDNETATPQRLAQLIARCLPYKPAGLVVAPPAEDDGTASVDALGIEIARWRNILESTRPYERLTRKRALAVFIPPDWGEAAQLAVALERYGIDVYTLNRLDQAGSYKKAVIFLGGLDSESEAKAAQFLESPPRGLKAIVFADGVRGSLGKKRSASCDSVLAEFLTTATKEQSRSLLIAREMPGDEDGLCKVVESYLEVSDYGILDSGFVKVVRADARIRGEGIWSLEEHARATIDGDVAAYDLAGREPVSGDVRAPVCVYTFPRAGARLVDPGVCRPLAVREDKDDVILELECPNSLSDAGAYRVVFWAPKQSEGDVGGGGAWTVREIGGGFYEATASLPGVHTLRIPGVPPKPVKYEWRPVDH